MILPISIVVGARTVIGSGSFATVGTEQVVISLGDLVYLLVFESTEDRKLDVVAEVAGEKSLRLRLLNFDNPLGSSYWAEVGEVNKKPLRLDLFVHSIGDPTRQRLVNYSFSAEVANG